MELRLVGPRLMHGVHVLSKAFESESPALIFVIRPVGRTEDRRHSLTYNVRPQSASLINQALRSRSLGENTFIRLEHSIHAFTVREGGEA